MKIVIEFEDGDETELETVTFTGACGTQDEFAATLVTLVSTTNYDFDAVVAAMLQYTSDEKSPLLYKACEEWWEKHQA